MSKSGKFNAFSGVFIPSILTILGVIMYLRLGWVVGEAGIAGALMIIILAHVISITTGLSISSIATDKKVGAGGVYYVLSRSLGLPIGGAIGLTLFVGTAFSIALYLIGFGESLNACLGLPTDANGLRFTGTLALVLLTTLAFISTSVAIKSQYFILGAIGLSLVSIFFGHNDAAPHHISMFGDGDAGFDTIFAIFFPAVTGFTAGIAMSGDLKNPKRDIPIGTISAVAVGLVVYVGLALFAGYSIDGELLRTDNNVFVNMALFAPFVLAGIWGATLSSALGGILGGPRILQAMSLDKITPLVFGRGSGKNNEPRNAVILTVIIAEAGILIGELDMIARVVSMFYLAAYGFINLSFYLESWASADFNPTFKIKKWIGLLGFIATFAVMFKLDMLAMIAAFVVIGGIFFWLKRKQIALGSGDVWGSVWSSLVKTGLQRMDQKEEHKRNWKPNILLFSGNTEQRPHLLKLSREIAGDVGLITNFDLWEGKQHNQPRSGQIVKEENLKELGIFGRRVNVEDIYSGIETIAGTYGFNGVEPNTVLMGWARNARDPVRFAKLTRSIINMDHNVLYLDYDFRYGFGDQGMIDLWWRGISSNAELMLNLARFLSHSQEWREAKVRILLVNDSDVDPVIIENRIRLKAEEFRVNAEIKIINNFVARKNFYELMKIHSSGTALVMLGVPEIKAGEENNFVDNTNDLVGTIGSTLLVKASSRFDETDLGLVKTAFTTETRKPSAPLPELVLPGNPALAGAIEDLRSDLKIWTDHFRNALMHLIAEMYGQQLTFVRQHLAELLAEQPADIIRKAPAFLEGVIRGSIHFREREIQLIEDAMSQSVKRYLGNWQHRVKDAPATLKRHYQLAELASSEDDKASMRVKKAIMRLRCRLSGKATVRIPFRQLLLQTYKSDVLNTLIRFQNSIGVNSHSLADFFHTHLTKELSKLIVSALQKKKTEAPEDTAKEMTASLFDALTQLYNEPIYQLQKEHIRVLNMLGQRMDNINVRDDVSIRADDENEKKIRKYKDAVLQYPGIWLENQMLSHRQMEAALHLARLKLILHQNCIQSQSHIRILFINGLQFKLKRLLQLIRSDKGSEALSKELAALSTEDEDLYYSPEPVLNRLSDSISDLVNEIPDEAMVFPAEVQNKFTQMQGEAAVAVRFALSRIADYLIESNMLAPLEQFIPQMCAELNHILARAQNIINLLLYALDQKEANNEELMQRSEADVEEIIEKLDAVAVKSTDVHERALAHSQTALDINEIVLRSDELEQYIRRQHRTKGLLKWLNENLNKLKIYINKSIRYIMRQKEEIDLASFAHESKQLRNVHSQIATFVERITPNRQVIELLPYYYRQLFSGKHLSIARHAETRQKQILEIAEAIDRWASGIPGAIMITGMAQSGKSFLVEHILHHHQKNGSYRIKAPASGMPDAETPAKALARATNMKGSAEEIMKQLPSGCIISIEDIESWWTRADGGDAAIKSIMQLIDSYGQKCLFILTADMYALEAINNFCRLDSVLLATVLLPPMNRVSFMDIVLGRHDTGGLALHYKGNRQAQISKKAWHRMIKNIYTASRGNIGLGLHLWLCGIVDFNEETIEYKDIEFMEFPDIEKAEWKAFLYQFIIHRNMSIKQLHKIFRDKDSQWIQRMLEEMRRSMILEDKTKGVYALKSYCRPFVTYWYTDIIKER